MISITCDENNDALDNRLAMFFRVVLVMFS
jgi:hypothetical protein